MLIYKHGQIEIFAMTENGAPVWYVYEGERLARVCPSEGMAYEIAAGLES